MCVVWLYGIVVLVFSFYKKGEVIVLIYFCFYEFIRYNVIFLGYYVKDRLYIKVGK